MLNRKRRVRAFRNTNKFWKRPSILRDTSIWKNLKIIFFKFFQIFSKNLKISKKSMKNRNTSKKGDPKKFDFFIFFDFFSTLTSKFQIFDFFHFWPKIFENVGSKFFQSLLTFGKLFQMSWFFFTVQFRISSFAGGLIVY